MNADLQLESEEGQGTRVTISIPLTEEEVQGENQDRSFSQGYQTEIIEVLDESMHKECITVPDEMETSYTGVCAIILPQPNQFNFIRHQNIQGERRMLTSFEQEELQPRRMPTEEEKIERHGSCDCARVLIVDDDFINR